MQDQTIVLNIMNDAFGSVFAIQRGFTPARSKGETMKYPQSA